MIEGMVWQKGYDEISKKAQVEISLGKTGNHWD